MNPEDFIRPSAVPALRYCAGQAVMQARICQRFPWLREMDSEQARIGTWAHEAIAQTLTIILDDGAEEGEALSLTMPLTSRLDAWTQASIRRAVAYATAMHQRLVDDHPGMQVRVYIERHLSGQGIEIPRGGTADLVFVVMDGDEAQMVVIIDWKCGFLEQDDAASHEQLHAYACMAWDKWRPQQGLEIHLGQCRLRQWSAASFNATTIEAARANTITIVDAARRDDAELRPCIKACRYCETLPWCRAAREHIMRAIEERALFGDDYADRAQQDADAALARRYAESVKAVQKERRRIEEQQTVTPAAGG